jgi:hypothetical protein
MIIYSFIDYILWIALSFHPKYTHFYTLYSTPSRVSSTEPIFTPKIHPFFTQIVGSTGTPSSDTLYRAQISPINDPILPIFSQFYG